MGYRKDDHAMRPIYGCSANFRESLSIRPRLLFPKFLMDIASPVPEITGSLEIDGRQRY